MRDGEPERREQAVTLVLGRENSLHHVATATGLLARVPRCPPLHAEENQEGRERKPRLVHRWQDAECGICRSEVRRRLLGQTGESPDRLYCEYREQDGASHGHYELEGIGDDDTPEA